MFRLATLNSLLFCTSYRTSFGCPLFCDLSFPGLYTCFIDGRSVALRNGINKFVMEISSNRTDRVYAMQELPSIYYIDRSLYMGYYGHHSDRNSSFSKRVFITSIFASLLKLSLDVAFDLAVADNKASLPPPPGPGSGNPSPYPHSHPSGPTHKNSRWSGSEIGSGSSRRVLSISMSSLAGFRNRLLDTASSSPSPSRTMAPSVINTCSAGDTEREVASDSDGESGERARKTGMDGIPPSVYKEEEVCTSAHFTGKNPLESARTDTTDMPRRAAVVYSAPSASITVRSLMPREQRYTAVPEPLLLLLTDASIAPSKRFSSPARHNLVLLSAVGAVLGIRLLRHPSGFVIKVFGIVVGSVRHMAQKVLGRDRGKQVYKKENSRQSDGQHKLQPVQLWRSKGESSLTGRRKRFKS